MNHTATPDRGEPVTLAVIIPCFNYRSYVGDAIESALRQLPPFDEIIVVDDGSTDGSVEVIRRYADRVRIIERANGGQISASREALATCRSEYVHILDADDFILEGFTRTVRPLLEDRPVKLQYQLLGVDAEGRSRNSIFPTYPANYDSERMREDNLALGFYICPPTTGNIYRRETLAVLPLDRLNQRQPIDGAPALVMPYLGLVKSVNVPLACYRVHGGNLSQWSRPTAELLLRETTIFLEHWNEARLLVCKDLLCGTPGSSVFVLERALMIEGLQATYVRVATTLAFVQTLLKTHVPTKFKIVISLWAFLFLIPSRRFRAYLVSARRTPVNRPAVFNWLMAFIRRGRIVVRERDDAVAPPRSAGKKDARSLRV